MLSRVQSTLPSPCPCLAVSPLDLLWDNVSSDAKMTISTFIIVEEALPLTQYVLSPVSTCFHFCKMGSVTYRCLYSTFNPRTVIYKQGAWFTSTSSSRLKCNLDSYSSGDIHPLLRSSSGHNATLPGFHWERAALKCKVAQPLERESEHLLGALPPSAILPTSKSALWLSMVACTICPKTDSGR